MSDRIVDPVPGVFTFVGDSGKSLRDLVLTLNDQWSFYMVRRVGDDAQLAGLEKTFEEVKDQGVDRGTMIAVESMKLGELNDHYPASSYTLRRSSTNKAVALEEIGSRIKATLKRIYEFILERVIKGFEYLKEKVSAAKQKLKRDKAEETVAFTTELFKNSEYLSATEIKSNPDLMGVGAALSESYSTLVKDLITNNTFTHAFQNNVTHITELTKLVEGKVATFKNSMAKIVTGNSGEAVTALKSIESSKTPPYLKEFLKLLDIKEDVLSGDVINRAQHKVGSLHDTAEPLDPLALSKISTLVKMGSEKIANGLFIFDDDTLVNGITACLADADAIKKNYVKLLATFPELDDEEAVKSALLGAMERLHTDTEALRFVIDFADQFFNILTRFIRNSVYYLNQCKLKKE